MYKVVTVANWGHFTPSRDVCLKCWFNNNNWALIHKQVDKTTPTH